jgi:hypothetical protein
VIDWADISDFKEPDWDAAGAPVPPALFWRPKKGATFGYIRDGELFDAKWIYVSDSNKVSHYALVGEPGVDKIVELASRRSP